MIQPIFSAPTSTLPRQQKSISALDQLIQSRKSIDFSFQSLTLPSFLKVFGSEYNVNIMNLASGVTKTIQSSLLHVAPSQVFDTLIKSWGCDWYIQNNIIYVVKQLPVEVFYLDYINATDALASLSFLTHLKGINIYKNKNAIIAQGYPNDLRQISTILDQLDIPPIQVLIEAKIVESNQDIQESFGIGGQITHTAGNKTELFRSNSPNPEHTAIPGLFIQTTQPGFNANLDATINRINGTILAQPSLRVTNHQTAVIITGQRLGYSTVSQSPNSTIEQIQFLETGIKLSCTPHISDQNTILMDIYPEVSEGQIEDNKPRETTTKAQTQVLVRDGETIVIGGLTRKKENRINRGVPILSDIPIINLFFQKTDSIDEKKEIVILITPHIISPPHSTPTVNIAPTQNLVSHTTLPNPITAAHPDSIPHSLIKPAQYSIEVLNGTPSVNLELDARTLLELHHYNVTKSGPAGHTNYPYTTIVDWQNNTQLAQEFAASLSISPQQIISKTALNKPLDFTLVIGQDWPSLSTQLQE